jgi:predicted esterase YcpF (UPF0227 family)
MFNLLKKSTNIEILFFHGFNSSTKSQLEQKIKSIIENIFKSKNINLTYTQNNLYGHAPNQTKPTTETTFQKLINK